MKRFCQILCLGMIMALAAGCGKGTGGEATATGQDLEQALAKAQDAVEATERKAEVASEVVSNVAKQAATSPVPQSPVPAVDRAAQFRAIALSGGFLNPYSKSGTLVPESVVALDNGWIMYRTSQHEWFVVEFRPETTHDMFGRVKPVFMSQWE